jgi:hypothetical protein
MAVKMINLTIILFLFVSTAFATPDCLPETIYVVVYDVDDFDGVSFAQSDCYIKTDRTINCLFILSISEDYRYSWESPKYDNYSSSEITVEHGTVTDSGLQAVLYSSEEREGYPYRLFICGLAGGAYYFDGFVNPTGYSVNNQTHLICGSSWTATTSGFAQVYQNIEYGCAGPFPIIHNFFSFAAFTIDNNISIEDMSLFCDLWLEGD